MRVSRLIAIAAILTGVVWPFSSFAGNSKICSTLLEGQKPLSELLERLDSEGPNSEVHVELVWILPSMSFAELQSLQELSKGEELSVAFNAFYAHVGKIVSHFYIQGFAEEVIATVRALENYKGEFKWTNLDVVSLEKHLSVDWVKARIELQESGFKIVSFTLDGSPEMHEMVILQLRKDSYIAPRMAYVFQKQNLFFRDLVANDLGSAVKMWRVGTVARVHIGSTFYLFADRKMLDDIRAVKKTNFLASGLLADVDILDWLDRRFLSHD